MLGIDIKVDSRQVKDAKQHIDMLNRSLNDTQSLGDLNIGEDGLPLASQRIKEMAEQVRRLQALSRQGTTRGGLLDPKQFQEAQEHMRRLNGTVQDYAKTLYSVRNEMLQLSKAQIDMRRSGQASTPEFKANRERLKQLQDERRELEAQERSVRKLGAQGSAAADDITGMGQNQGRNGYGGLKKALGWTLAAAGGFSLLGFLAQSRAKYQQSVGHEATLSARGINGGFGDNVGIGVGPLEQMALLESISQQAGMGGRRANRAANLSGAFGRYAGVDPSQVASLYGSMYHTTGDANLATGAINMMGEAIKKGMDKAKTTELLTLVSRNTQVTAAAMHGAGATSAQAGAATAMAIEAILAHQGGASFGQYAKSQEFMNVMQNGLQGAGTGAGDIRLFSAMGGFDGPMTWEKIHEMNVLKQGGFMQSPELMSKIMGGLSGSKEARAGQLETMMASWGIKGASSEKLIEMNDSGFFGRLAKATKGGAKKIESLQHGTKEERALYDEYKRNASSLDGVSKLSLEATKEQEELKTGERIHEMLGNIERGLLETFGKVMDGDFSGAIKSLNDAIGPAGIALGAGVAGLHLAGLTLNTAGVGLNVAAARLGAPPIPAAAAGASVMGAGIGIIPAAGTAAVGGASVWAAKKISSNQVRSMGTQRLMELRSQHMVMGGGPDTYQVKLINEEIERRKAAGEDVPDVGSSVRSAAAAAGITPSDNERSDKRKRAMLYFMTQGWTKEQAAGIVGNLDFESIGMNHKAKNSKGMYGLAQWNKERRNRFKKTFGKPIEKSTFEDQLQFIQHELENDESSAGSSLKKAKTAAEAAVIFDKKYERSEQKHHKDRILLANKAYQESGYQQERYMMPERRPVDYPIHQANNSSQQGLWGGEQFNEIMKVLRDIAYGRQTTKPIAVQ